MLFFRVFEHLLPDAIAWRMKAQKKLRSFFEGLTGAPSDARAFVDEVYEDLSPSTTRELPAWERQFALPGTGTDADRRAALDAAWKAMGGQDPRYLQDILQAAGFPLYIHEWWVPGTAPPVARDPRGYTLQPLIGTVQCGEPWALCGEPAAQANRWLVNDPRYLVNQNLTPIAPPPIPSDPDRWPHFVYFGGETFGTSVDVPVTRRAELEELLLRLRPTHLWIVLMVNWTAVSGFRVTLDGDRRVTLSGDSRITLGA